MSHVSVIGDCVTIARYDTRLAQKLSIVGMFVLPTINCFEHFLFLF